MPISDDEMRRRAQRLVANEAEKEHADRDALVSAVSDRAVARLRNVVDRAVAIRKERMKTEYIGALEALALAFKEEADGG